MGIQRIGIQGGGGGGGSKRGFITIMNIKLLMKIT